jgi:hypothetical protein
MVCCATCTSSIHVYALHWHTCTEQKVLTTSSGGLAFYLGCVDEELDNLVCMCAAAAS